MNNELFITNEVRDYIKEVNNAHINNYKVTTTAINLKLYISLCKFIENIYIYDTVDKKNTLKNYIINMVCSNEFDTQKKQSNLSIFIESINPNKYINVILKKTLLSVYNNIYKILEQDNIEKQKKYINKILGNYFNKDSDKNSDILLHDSIKKKLNNNKEDAKLYLEFFKIIECDDNYCNNPRTIKDYNKETSRFSLIRDDETKHVKLLEIFNGKDVKIIVTDTEIEKINNYKNSYYKIIETIMKPYYDEMVKLIIESWGWVWGENNTIKTEEGDIQLGGNIQYGGNKNIIDALYVAIKDIFKNFIKITDDYKTNIWNFVSSYFNGKNDSSMETDNNKHSMLQIIGDSTDSIRRFIKTTLYASFEGIVIIPNMIIKAVNVVMNSIKNICRRIMKSIKNYTLNKILGESETHENKIEEYKNFGIDKIKKYTEDADVFLEKNFKIKTELKNNEEKLIFITKKMLGLSSEIKKEKYEDFVDFSKKINITADNNLNSIVKNFDNIVSKIDQIKDNRYIKEYFEYVDKTFNIQPELKSEFDKLTYMADEVIKLVGEKKKEYINYFLEFFKTKFDIVPKLDENNYIVLFQNVIDKIENGNEEKMDLFINYIKNNYILEEVSYIQKKYIIYNIGVQIIEKFEKDEEKIKKIILYVKETLNIEPSLTDDVEIIENMLNQLKNNFNKKLKELIDFSNEKIDLFMNNTESFVEGLGIDTKFKNNKDKFDYIIRKIEKDIKLYFKKLLKYCKDNGLINTNIYDEENDNNFKNIVDITKKINDIEIEKFLLFANEKLEIKTNLDSNFDKITYMFDKTIESSIIQKEEYLKKTIDMFKKYGITIPDISNRQGKFNYIIDMVINSNTETIEKFIKNVKSIISPILLSKLSINFNKKNKIAIIEEIREKFKNNNECMDKIIEYGEKKIKFELNTDVDKLKYLFMKLKNYGEDKLNVAIELKDALLNKAENFFIDISLINEDLEKDKNDIIEIFKKLDINKDNNIDKFKYLLTELEITLEKLEINNIIDSIGKIKDKEKIKKFIELSKEIFSIKLKPDIEKLKDMYEKSIDNFSKKKDEVFKNTIKMFNGYGIKIPDINKTIGKFNYIIDIIINSDDTTINNFIKYIKNIQSIKFNKKNNTGIIEEIREILKNDSKSIDKIIKYGEDVLKIKFELNTDEDKLKYLFMKLKNYGEDKLNVAIDLKDELLNKTKDFLINISLIKEDLKKDKNDIVEIFRKMSNIDKQENIDNFIYLADELDILVDKNKNKIDIINNIIDTIDNFDVIMDKEKIKLFIELSKKIFNIQLKPDIDIENLMNNILKKKKDDALKNTINMFNNYDIKLPNFTNNEDKFNYIIDIIINSDVIIIKKFINYIESIIFITDDKISDIDKIEKIREKIINDNDDKINEIIKYVDSNILKIKFEFDSDTDRIKYLFLKLKNYGQKKLNIAIELKDSIFNKAKDFIINLSPIDEKMDKTAIIKILKEMDNTEKEKNINNFNFLKEELEIIIEDSGDNIKKINDIIDAIEKMDDVIKIKLFIDIAREKFKIKLIPDIPNLEDIYTETIKAIINTKDESIKYMIKLFNENLGINITFENNNDKIKYIIYKIKNSDNLIINSFIEYLKDIGIELDSKIKDDIGKLINLDNVLINKYGDKINEIILKVNEKPFKINFKLNDIEKIQYMIEKFKNKDFLNNDTIKNIADVVGIKINEDYSIENIIESSKKKILELANTYAVEFPYFTNNIDKLDDIRKKITNLINLKPLEDYIDTFDKDNITKSKQNINSDELLATFFESIGIKINDINIIDETSDDYKLKDNIFTFIDILKTLDNESENLIYFSKIRLDINIENNFTNNIEKIYDIIPKIDKFNIDEVVGDLEKSSFNYLVYFYKKYKIFLDNMKNEVDIFKNVNLDLFNKADYFLYYIKKNYKLEPEKNLTNNIEKINSIINKFKNIKEMSLENIENNKKYKFLKFFDDNFSIQPDINNKSIDGNVNKNNKNIDEQCNDVLEKIKKTEKFIDYDSWVKNKKYKSYDIKEIKLQLFNYFKNDCFAKNEISEYPDIDSIYNKIISCNTDNSLISFLKALVNYKEEKEYNITSMDEITDEIINKMVSKTDIFLNYLKINSNIEPSILNDDEKTVVIEKTKNLYIKYFKYTKDPIKYKEELINIAKNSILPEKLKKIFNNPNSSYLSWAKGISQWGYEYFNPKDPLLYDSENEDIAVGAIVGGFSGGTKIKCYTIDNLKQLLLKILVNITESVELDERIPSGDITDCYIEMNGKSYILKKESIKKDEVEQYKKEMQIKKVEYTPNIIDDTNCFKKTKLFKKNIIKNKNIWDSIDDKIKNKSNNKNNNKNLLNTPNGFDILKDSEFFSQINYQIGGNVYDTNDKFIRNEKIDIDIEYSYEIVSLLKKALKKLNNNHIYLEEKTIKEIKDKINILKNAEIELSKYAINIVNASKNNYNKNNFIGGNNNITLEEYCDKHQKLLIYADKNAIILNKTIIKLLDLV